MNKGMKLRKIRCYNIQ